MAATADSVAGVVGIGASATASLIEEMERRYKTIAEKGTRNIVQYNKKIKKEADAAKVGESISTALNAFDGIEVLRQVKRDYPGIEVIILTGHGSERAARDGIAHARTPRGGGRQ